MPMKKTHDFKYGFKSQCTSTNEQLSKFEGCLNSIRKNKSKTFTPIGNEFLPTSKNIKLTNYHIMYRMKHKDICDNDPRCIMSSGLMFHEIIMDIKGTMNCHTLLKKIIVVLHILKTSLFICTGGHFNILTEKKELTSV